MRLPILLPFVAGLLVAASPSARTLSMPDGATAAMPRSLVAGTPPDFEALAEDARSMTDADEIERSVRTV